MTKILQHTVTVLLVLVMLLILVCCGEKERPPKEEIIVDPGVTDEPGTEVEPDMPPSDAPQDVDALVLSMDENGFVTWEAIEGADYEMYYYYFGRDGARAHSELEVVREDGGVYLSDGYGLTLVAHYADGTVGDWVDSGIYGDPAKRDPYRLDIGYVDPTLTTLRRDLLTYDLIDAIRYDTVVTAENGSVTFEADAPNGGTMRFYGHGIRVADDGITMMSSGFLTALDAIGRIYFYQVDIVGANMETHGFLDSGGYTLTDRTSVDSYLDLTYTLGYAEYVAGDPIPFDPSISIDETLCVDFLAHTFHHQPNFIAFRGSMYYGAFKITELNVKYLDDAYTTDIELARLYEDFTGAYLEGERYALASAENPMNFYLIAVPQLRDRKEPMPQDITSEQLNTDNALFTVTSSLYHIEGLRDADGRELDIHSAPLTPGASLDVVIGDDLVSIPINVLPQFNSANVMHELVPHAYPLATGTIHTLVIPIRWQDDPSDMDETYARFLTELGRVVDESGEVKDYSDAPADKGRFSLSEYYDVASYGKLKVQSFMTDWYRAPYNFSEMRDRAPDPTFTDAVLAWLYERYPTMDWSRFDQDANGYFDAVILLNAGDINAENGYQIISFGGGIWTRYSYTGEYAGTPERPTINGFTNMNAHLFEGNTLIHEFAHGLGLIDYYDVSYSGIDAVGRFDMQSGSYGDWNVYSKYAVGWLEPEVVTGLEKGQSAEITIGASALTGDAIVIPGAANDYNGTPFDEYIMVDLFADAGVNVYDTSRDGFELDDVIGVRIYHVNALMERRELTVEGRDDVYPIGTIHMANNNTGDGKFNVELIQSGKDNTFTDMDNLRANLTRDDLFTAGDVFTVESYGEFFGNELLDDGTSFGYKIEIVNITKGESPTATVRITRQ